MKVLRKRALQDKLLSKPWATPETFPDIIDCEGGYRSIAQYKIELAAPIDLVQRILARALKPGRSLVSAVKFTSGRIEETVTVPVEQLKKPEAAVTVAAPTRGCPQPSFAPAEIKATRVLSAFLTKDQQSDFARKNCFVATGADTGHRYLVTSRHAVRANFDRGVYRGQLYDLDERKTFCVHDWDVPAAEEMLGLLIHLTLPGREKYLRDLPEAAG